MLLGLLTDTGLMGGLLSVETLVCEEPLVGNLPS